MLCHGLRREMEAYYIWTIVKEDSANHRWHSEISAPAMLQMFCATSSLFSTNVDKSAKNHKDVSSHFATNNL